MPSDDGVVVLGIDLDGVCAAFTRECARSHHGIVSKSISRP